MEGEEREGMDHSKRVKVWGVFTPHTYTLLTRRLTKACVTNVRQGNTAISYCRYQK